ncbi:RNA 2',3'-cyclic phosphodiesterase [Streptomyces sp. TR06-5]|uniref:RNA 2',3'-cyclic phosphodiesterase n=1 Tax=unclassified Streptomyces TaxID=2593676 RepID=UPI0039A24EB4
MRLFAALLPPDAALGALAETVASLRVRPDADGLRWTAVGGWHITLAFYGEADEEHTLPGLRERLSRSAARSRPLDLRVAGAGRFGRRALWAGVEGDREALRQLARSAAAAGRRSGLTEEEGRSFHAHLTVARARGRGGAVDLRPYADRLAAVRGEPWTATELVLVRSHLPVSGVRGEQPHYETVASWRLGR